jgi:micrococcal nuclease
VGGEPDTPLDPTPRPAQPVEPPAPASYRDPSYPTLRLPIGAPDLDSGEIRARRFQVLTPDPHGFDGDNDGVGCEGG